MNQPSSSPIDLIAPNGAGGYRASSEKARAIISFTIPDKLRKYVDEGVTTLGFVELKSGEEMLATKRCHNDGIRLVYELVKESLRMVGAETVGTGDGSADRAWAKMHPKIRQLCSTAYNELHNLQEGDSESFLKSRAVTVG